jgi:hypothetical protein
MTEALEFETYLSISSKKFKIYLLDTKNLKNLYFEEKNFENSISIPDLNNLEKFLDNNIFKIEKLIGKFVKNINLILDTERFLRINISLKKNNYEQIVNKKILENSLYELKDLFNESYQDYKIVHMLLVSYLIDGSHYSELKFDLNFKNLSLETQFIALPIKLVIEINKILENYHIKITNYFDQNYIQTLFKGQNIDLSEMAYKSKFGFNNNEVSLIPKNIKKTGFFEKFFQLFS